MVNIDWMDITIPFCIHTFTYAHDIRQLNICVLDELGTGSAMPVLTIVSNLSQTSFAMSRSCVVPCKDLNMPSLSQIFALDDMPHDAWKIIQYPVEIKIDI